MQDVIAGRIDYMCNTIQTGAIQARQGNVKAIGHSLSGGVGSDGALVAVGTIDGEVIALDAGSGQTRWSARVSSEVLAAPVVTGDLVIVRSADSRLFALDAKDGKRRWLYQRSSPAL